MIDIWIDAGDLDKLQARINGADILNAAFQDVRPGLERDLAAYPNPRRAKQPFKTEKQRRYFFWALSEGKIRVPYQRRDGIKKAWKVHFQVSGTRVEMAFTNTAPHASGVIGQNPWGYHKGYWPQAHLIAAKYQPIVVKAVEDQAKKRA